ncbi:MAG: xanthine dehydrogenase family protein subunit M [Myxococcales bacterium]|nr:xanthine dehydrogenase family protein subunit M [Myxococcales bacterium]
MLTSPAKVLCPATLDEALRLRAQHPDAMPLAGGTDVMVFLEAGAIAPAAFLNLWGLPGLDAIATTPGGLRLGALCTYTTLIHDKRVQAAAPALVEAARTVGALQIQNRGTLGGNIANASPAGDTLPVLLALDAEVEVQSLRGARRVPFDGLYTGYRKLALAPDELITAVHLPTPHAADHTHFRKVGTRLAQAISKVILGGRLRIEGGVVTDARVAFGSVAPVPVRARAVEKALLGKPVDVAAADAVSADIQPIDDVRSTAEYRLSVARRVLRSWLASLAEGA